MTVGTSGARRGRRHGRRSPGSGRRQEGQALDHHRVAPRQFVQLVIPAVAPVAVELQEVLVGAAIAPRGRCGGDVDGLLLGLGGAAPASALTLPPSSSQRPASNRAWLACRSSSRQLDQPSAGGPVVSAELPRRPIEPKPTISESTPTGSSKPPHSRDRARGSDRPGRRRDTGVSCRPRISHGASPGCAAPPADQQARLGLRDRLPACGRSERLLSDAACVAYSTTTTKTTITAMTNAAIAMVRASMTRSLRLIVPARAPAPWRTGDSR
jgi:hypothetical protein